MRKTENVPAGVAVPGAPVETWIARFVRPFLDDQRHPLVAKDLDPLLVPVAPRLRPARILQGRPGQRTDDAVAVEALPGLERDHRLLGPIAVDPVHGPFGEVAESREAALDRARVRALGAPGPALGFGPALGLRVVASRACGLDAHTARDHLRGLDVGELRERVGHLAEARVEFLLLRAAAFPHLLGNAGHEVARDAHRRGAVLRDVHPGDLGTGRDLGLGLDPCPAFGLRRAGNQRLDRGLDFRSRPLQAPFDLAELLPGGEIEVGVLIAGFLSRRLLRLIPVPRTQALRFRARAPGARCRSRRPRSRPPTGKRSRAALPPGPGAADPSCAWRLAGGG